MGYLRQVYNHLTRNHRPRFPIRIHPTRLLPHARQIILRRATHRMWFEQPEACRNHVLEFLREPAKRNANSLHGFGAFPKRLDNRHDREAWSR